MKDHNSDIGRDQEQNSLALQARNNNEAMNQLRISLEPLTNHIVELYIAQYHASEKNENKINKAGIDALRSTLMETAWSALPKAVDSFNAQSTEDNYNFGTYFSFLARNVV